ncbi:MAG: hypothetical protein D6773_06100, partial [Alphaproteobacteria bacterium]
MGMIRMGRAALVALAAATVAFLGDAALACESDRAILDADFEGARMSACRATRSGFAIAIEPENSPVNPSPWYAFRVTPKKPGTIKIVMRYSQAAHRYRPKRSEDAENWRLVDPGRVRVRNKGKRVALRLEMGTAPFFVAGQELLLTADYRAWI